MKRCPEALWEDLARADESATFFQTPAWHAVAAAHFRAESFPLLFEFPRGPVCLPLLRDRRWGRWRWFSPFGTYTAPLCAYTLTPEERARIEAFLRTLNVHLASSPFTRNPVTAGRELTARIHAIDLAGVDPDDPARGWERDARRRARRARAEGLRVRQGTGDADWKAYAALYRDSLNRWGDRATSAYPDSLLERIRTQLEHAPSFRFWVVESREEGAGREGVLRAGFLGFYHNRHAALWHAAADAEVFRSGGVQLLYHEMIADAARRGFKVFDLLGSNGLAGVEAFKESLGATPLSFTSSLNRTGLVGRIGALRDRCREGWFQRWRAR